MTAVVTVVIAEKSDTVVIMQAHRKTSQVSWLTIFANGFPWKPGGARRPLDTAQVLRVVNTQL